MLLHTHTHKCRGWLALAAGTDDDDLLTGQALNQAPATSSACYSPITMTTASWLTGVFHYDPATRTMLVKSIAEAPSISASNYQDMSKWFTGLMQDTFA